MPRVKLNLPREFVKSEGVERNGRRFKLTSAPTRGNNFLVNGERRLTRIFRGRNGASNNEIVRTGAYRFYWSGNARLILRGGATRSHARHNNQEFRAAGATNRSRFLRRAYDSIKPRLFRQPRQRNHA